MNHVFNPLYGVKIDLDNIVSARFTATKDGKPYFEAYYDRDSFLDATIHFVDLMINEGCQIGVEIKWKKTP